jgi:hypothetical protein
MNQKTILFTFLISIPLAFWLARSPTTQPHDCHSLRSGSWSDVTIWRDCDGRYPGQSANDRATIHQGHTVTLDNNPPKAVYRLAIEPGGVFDLNGYSLAFSGDAGAPGLVNEGQFHHAGGTLLFVAEFGTAVQRVAGPVKLAKVAIEGVGVRFQTDVLIEEELAILFGGFVAEDAPSYAAQSTLIYRTSGPYTAGAEWAANASSGPGVPHHVYVEWYNGNTSLTLGPANRTMTGDLTLDLAAFTGPPAGHTLTIGGQINQNWGLFDNNQSVIISAGSKLETIGQLPGHERLP